MKGLQKNNRPSKRGKYAPSSVAAQGYQERLRRRRQIEKGMRRAWVNTAPGVWEIAKGILNVNDHD